MSRPHRARSTLPLPLRLPNPPVVFIGREVERARVAEAIARAPVTCVVGPGGVGKTALVLEVLHRGLEARAERTIYLAVRDGEPGNELRVRLLAALADAEREAALDLVGAAADVEETVTLALELAERRPWCVLLDDVHHAPDAGGVDALLGALARYARRSRWIVTSRSEPSTRELRGQIMTLDGMRESDLVELGAQLAPDASQQALHRAAAAASGSPWLLAQQVAGGEGTAAERDRLLAGLDARAADLLRALAIVPEGLAPATIARTTPLPDARALEWLERRGLLTATGEVLRLHPVVRGLLVAPGPRVAAELAEWRVRVRDAAGYEGASLGDRIVALELSCELGDVAAMETALVESGEALLEAGLAPRLWRVLERAPRVALHPWRLRCAAELGNPTVLEGLAPPLSGDVDERLVWARTRVARGEHEDARRAVAPLLSTPARARAALVDARAALHAGRLEHAAAQARAAIEASEEGDGAWAARALAARCDAVRGQAVDEEELERLASSRTLDAEARVDVAAALLEVDRPADAEAAIESLLALQRDAVRLFAVREATLLAARARFERGLVEEATALADEVRSLARSPSVQRAVLCALDLDLCLASGRLAGMSARIEAALRSCADVDAISLRRAQRAAARWAVASGSTISSGGDDRVDVVRAEHRLRWHGEAAPSGGTGRSARARLAEELLRALEALVGGEAVGAATLASDVTRAAERAGLPWVALDAERVRCDAIAAQGDLAALRAAATALLERARALGAAGVVVEAELMLSQAAPASLESIAQLEHRSPVAVRRARALLGAPVALDRVDELVLLALDSHGATPTITTLAPSSGPWTPGWGLDARRSAVWLEDGTEIALAKTPLLARILEVLFEGGGRAAKEELAQRAWGEAEYHPLRHDARMQVAVRKLREKVERDPSRPARVVTTEDGYALAGTVRRAAARRAD